ncbi:MAG: two-component sensor histidine kinase, partial [Myxococcaceae bacterium]|nr:two-component sensor histidine kinase [Myxococcaceae bacterium]
MKWRIASIAFLLGTLTTGVVWLALQPTLVGLMAAVRRLAPPEGPERALLAHLRTLLPLWLGLALVGATLLCFGLLHLTVGRPLRETEDLVARIGKEGELLERTPSGPLLRRVHIALARTSAALSAERERTGQQLDALREANARLARTQMELVSTERLATVGRLAAGVAHEVGNPLSGILGYLALVRAQVDGAPAALEHLAHIEAEVERINGIIRSLLDLGRPSAGRPIPVELHRQVDATVRLVAAGREFSHVHVLQHVHPDLVSCCEPGALAQILINLLLNAAHA